MLRSASIPRLLLLLLCVVIFALARPCHAAAIDETIPDAPTLILLQQRALAAAPREQCYLFAELAHIFTELARQQWTADQPDLALASLKQVTRYTSLVHDALSSDSAQLSSHHIGSRHIKETEKLVSHTTHRLSDYLSRAATEDRPALMATMVQLDRLHNELLNEVFAR